MTDKKKKQATANKRGSARLAAVQALYQMDMTGISLLEIVAEYESYRLGKELDDALYLESDPQWFRAIVAGVVGEQNFFDPLIAQALINEWSLSRLDSIIRAILRAACYELKNKKEVPVAVVINEYVDIAKAFFIHEEPKMIHAILDRLTKTLRPVI